MQVPTIGRIVHYKHPNEAISERPAIIVLVWSPGLVTSPVQLQVFMDSDPDGQYNDGRQSDVHGSVEWQTSVMQGQAPGEYHFHEDCLEA